MHVLISQMTNFVMVAALIDLQWKKSFFLADENMKYIKQIFMKIIIWTLSKYAYIMN